MASVFPKARPTASDKISRAELDVLDQLAKLPPDWIVLHSLWLKTHSVKLDAEADFVVISDRAVLLLEIKGGDVWRDDEGWHFRRSSGSEGDVKREGPLDQARGAYYAVRTYLRELARESLFEDFVWGYGAILPECLLKVGKGDISFDAKMLLDERSYPAGLESFLFNLAAYWSASIRGEVNHLHRKNHQPNAWIELGKRQEIATCLRPRLELIVGVGAQATSSENAILRLTEQQLAALDFACAEPRNIFLGAAGTGKTVLAVEEAKRRSVSGKRVLLVCFNRLLARKISRDLRIAGVRNVEATNFHQLAIQLVKSSGRLIDFAEDWDNFSQMLQRSLVDLVSQITDQDRFDYLIVDESQDLMTRDFMDLLDCLLKGGLKSGSWLIAVDEQQAIFRENFDKEVFEQLCEHGRRVPLEINCRNTKQIAAYVRALSGVGAVSAKSAEGEHPGIRYYADRNEYLRILKKLVNELIASFTSLGMPASAISVLSVDASFIPAEIRVPGFFLRPAKQFDPDDLDDGAIRIGTVQAFKGLESSAVVLVGIERFETSASRELFYVGASRAKAVLRILLPSTCDQIQRAVPEITRLLGTEVASGSSL